MSFTDAELAALDSDTQRLGFFFRLATDPVIRLWMGAGPVNQGANALDPGGAVYDGFGTLAAAPAFQQLINGAAERIDFTLSPVSPEILALASTEADQVALRPCDLGFAIMDPTWQFLGPIHWTRRGYADFLKLDVTPAQDPSGQTTRSVTLSVGSLMTGRRRRGLSFWTDQDQQSRFPGDRFCERTVLYSQLIQKVWPRF